MAEDRKVIPEESRWEGAEQKPRPDPPAWNERPQTSNQSDQSSRPDQSDQSSQSGQSGQSEQSEE